MKVTAKDLDSQKEQQITISGTSGLSKADIDRMVREAEENRDADEKRKEEVELKNKAEQYIASIDQALAEKGDSLEEAQKAQTTKLRDELKAALDAHDIETLRNRLGELEQAAAMMANASAKAPHEDKTSEASSEAKDNGASGDDVIDADFTEKKN